MEVSEQKNGNWLYVLSAVFVLINATCSYFGFFYLNLLPAAFLIVLLALFSLDKLILFVVFLTPLAVNLQDTDVGLGLSLPTEPIIFSIMVLFFIKQLHTNTLDKKVLNHPVTLFIILNLMWIFVTAVTSAIPVISFKFLIARLWFVVVFYFMSTQLFKVFGTMKKFLWLYTIAFVIVIVYTLYNHYLRGFEEDPAHWVMSPFYNDHTAYGAIIAMFFPVVVFFMFNKQYSSGIKFAAYVFFVMFSVALIYSYTRAAWLSLAAATGAYMLLKLKIQFRTLLFAGIFAGALFLLFQTEIVMKLSKNKQDTSQDFDKHIQSMSNITTDASNLERLNRWEAAFGMFAERPILGWGPGTYSFVYAPFQLAKNKTIISTNMGDGGNAHSEYIGPLCESGVLGALSFIAIVLAALFTGFRLYYTVSDNETKGLVLAVLLGFITYIIHGALNNFLDTDKASVPFWGFIAMLVAIDCYHNKRQIELKES